jgi:4-hydroxybenzoate polyprenyltransferase
MLFIQLLDYFFVLRPILFFAGWTTTLAGFLAAYPDTGEINQIPTTVPLALVIVSSAMVMGAGFIVNQWKDRETDRVNKKLFFLSEEITHSRIIILEAFFLIVSSLAIAAFISATMFMIHALSLFVITVLYNLKPFSLKDKTLGSAIALVLMGAFAFMYGWFLNDTSLKGFLISVLPYILFNTSLCFLTTIPDTEGDKLTSKRTISVVYGFSITVYLAVAFEIAAIVLGAILEDRIILLTSLLSFPLYAYLLIRRDVPAAVFTIKFSGLLFSLIVGVFFPWYLILIGVFFFGTRWYYRKRFAMNYPNFRGE